MKISNGFQSVSLRLLSLGVLFSVVAFCQTPSSISLTASPNPAIYGQPVTLLATVTTGATGAVTFYDGTTILGVGTISGNQASLTTIMLPAGLRSVRAYYIGDTAYAAATSPVYVESVAAGQSLGWRPPIKYPAGGVAYSVASGDFNGDGKQDFVVANSPGVTVFLGNGDGTFQAGVQYVAPAAQTVVVGDFNGDGKLDLATANRSSSSVNVLLGNGNGTFQPQISYPCGAGVNAMVVADVNGDGKADLVLSPYSGSTISVLLGKGDGSFGAAVTSTASSNQYSLATADLNGDGKVDVVVGTYGGLVVLLGIGDGTFAAPLITTQSTNIYGIAVADLNGDGKADLICSTYYNGIDVYLGNGDGTFRSPVFYQDNGYLYSVVVADLDGDGRLDVATVNQYSSGAINIFYGNGDGTLRPMTTSGVGSYPSVLIAGEFNGDGKTDLIVASSSNTDYYLVRGGALPDMTISASHGGGFTQGQTGAVYSITVSNVGETASSGAVGVVISLGSGLSATSLAGNGWTCVLSSLSCVRSDSIPNGSSVTITATVNISPALTGNAVSSFTVLGGGEQNYANNFVTDTAYVRHPTTTTLSSSPNPSILGHAVVLTATVTNGVSGTVEFYDGISFLGSSAVTAGQAVFSTSLLPSGSRSLRAQYTGDTANGPSFSAIRSHIVNPVGINGAFAPTSYKLGDSPQWIGSGDFNADGKTDLVTVNYSGISILIGNGDGTFRPAVNYSAGNGYFAMAAVGDFNGDGNADVAVIGNGGMYFFPGKGDGTFGAASAISTSITTNFLAAADFDSDGKLDLAVMSGGNVAIFFGKGDGTFQAPTYITATGNYNSFSVADINTDGKPDFLIVGNPSAVLLGNGDGTFQPPLANSLAQNSPGGLVIGDFNGDGKPDVASVYWVGAQIQLGNGDGTFQSSIQSSLGFTPGYFILAGDFDGDGKLDILNAGYYNSQVYIAFGNGNGTLQYSSGYSVAIPTDSYTNAAVLGDFNGDGKPDIAVSNSGTNSVDIFLGGQFTGLTVSSTHAGVFTSGKTGTYQIAVRNLSFATTNSTVTVTDTLPAGLTATAISGNGWTCTLSSLTCTRNDGLSYGQAYPTITMAVTISGSLAPTTLTNKAFVSYGGIINAANDSTVIVSPTATTLTVGPNPSSLGQTATMIATVTAGASGTVLFLDGSTPLGSAVVASGQATFSTRLLGAGQHLLQAEYSGDSTHASGISTVRRQTVSATTASGMLPAVTYPVGSAPWAIVADDFNRDGNTDLVTANSNSNTVSVLLGNGTGSFGASTEYSVGTKPVSVVSGDFNRDGKPDLAVVNQNSNNVSILLGNGNGTFQPAVNYAVGNGPDCIAAGDLNSDGVIDLVIGNSADGTLTILFGNGDGTFHPAPTPVQAYSVNQVVIGDLNLDGNADILYSTSGYTSVYALLGNGDGTFQPSLYINTNYSVYAISLGDLNGDGILDVVTADSAGVSVLLGKGDGTFTPGHYSTGNQGAGIVVTDMNGDNKLDVVVANTSANTISILMGNGDGTLQPAISYFGSSGPRAIAAGEFNGDGRTDLAVVNSTSNNISVILGVLTPVLTVSSSHTDPVGLNQQGVVYTLVATNNGPGSTSGTVTMTDTLPTGMTATALSGTGWTCTLGTLTCTRSDALAPGFSYPAVTLTANTAMSSAGTVFNQVMVFGGGAVGAIRMDPTTIAVASLGISLSHIGSFYQGQSNATYQVVVSNQGGATYGTVTVTEALPTGLTFVSMTGSSWNCSTVTATCTRTDALGMGGSYPPITIIVSIASNAPTSLTNHVSVSASGATTATANDTATLGPARIALTFVPITPCRVVDTRNPDGPFGGPILTGGNSRDFILPNGACGIPANAQAYSLNAAIVPNGAGWITIWGAGQPKPLAASVNSPDGRVKSNGAIVPAGTGGAITVAASVTTHVIFDVNGYFVPASSNPTALAFYPITPCRLADTRNAMGSLGGPYLSGGSTRSFAVFSSNCNIPASAQAFSLNLAVVPLASTLQWITAWPANQPKPNVASLNDTSGVILSNGAIVPAPSDHSGQISIFTTQDTHLVIDINGYFAPPGSGGLSLYPLQPCRVLDTRNPSGSPAFTGALAVDVVDSGCGAPLSAQDYVFNATVVPTSNLGFLTMWQQGQTQPLAANLNASDGAITGNMALVPTSNGWVNAYYSGTAFLVLDLFGYFAP